MTYETIVVGPLDTNCYLVICEETGKCAVVDPGAEPAKIIRSIRERELEPVVILNTHGHVDHIGANKDIKDRFPVPLRMHQADLPLLHGAMVSEISSWLDAKASPEPDGFLMEGDRISIGGSFLKVLHTPGHSPGSVSLLGSGILFTGDTLFCGGVGRTDLPGGSWPDLESSIRDKILTLSDELIILPGHGPSSTIGREKDSNPFIQ